MTYDLKAQPASIISAICGLRRIIIVFKKTEWTNEFMNEWTSLLICLRESVVD